MLKTEALHEHEMSGSALRKQMRLSLANKQTSSDDAVVMRTNKDIDSERDSSIMSPQNIRCCDCDYVNCYTLTSRGHLQTPQWMHHSHTTDPAGSVNPLQQPCDSTTTSKQDAVMMQLVREIVFRQIDSVPECVRQPPQSCPKFVVSHYVDGTLSSLHYKSHVHHEDHTNRGASIPPPVPARPTNLSVTDSTRHSQKNYTVTGTNNDQGSESTAVTTGHCVSDKSTTSPDVFAQQEFSPMTDESDAQERSIVSANISEEDSEKVGTPADDDDAETVILRRLVTADNENVEHGTSVEGDDFSASVCEVKCCETLSLSSSTCANDAGKAGTLLETSGMFPELCNESSVTDRHDSTFECTDEPQIATAADGNSLSHSVGHHDDEHERAVAADIERLYSFVRKKADRTRCSNVVTADMETVKPNLGRSDKMTEMVRDDDNVQSFSLCRNVEQASSDICCESLPPFATGVEVPSPTLNQSPSDIEVSLANGDDATDSSSQSSCEDISQRTLDGELQHYRESGIVEYRTLTSGTLLLAYQDLTFTLSNTKLLPKNELEPFMETLLAYDEQGCAFYVPAVDLKLYGDPAGELWFFPVPITPLQATILLSTKQIAGSFLVYYEFPRCDSLETLRLSLYYSADVLHYSIVRNRDGDLSLAGDDRSFLTLSDLISYFQHNKSRLATRLGRPLAMSHLPLTAGVDYDAKYELARSQLTLTGNIIGNGRFGVICAGKYRGHPVAVKVLNCADPCPSSSSLHPAVLSNEEAEWMDEAHCLMMVNHRSIVRLVGVVASSRPMYIVTELAAHGSLKECLRHSDLFNQSDVHSLLSLCMQVVSALCYLDSIRYIIHRDVAARNFLVTNSNSIKLADFGRARYVPGDDNYQASKSDMVCVKWSSPEVLIRSCYSTRSDIWAAGVVMWEILTAGERPYNGLTAEQTAVYVISGGRLDRPDNCPHHLYTVVASCWQHRLTDRPSATELVDRLRETSLAMSQPSLTGAMESLSYHKQTSFSSLSSSFVTAFEKTSVSTCSDKSPSTTTTTTTTSRLPERRGTWNDLDNTANDDHCTPSSSSSSSSVQRQLSSRSAEDLLTRGDKIRHSLRKLVNMRLV